MNLTGDMNLTGNMSSTRTLHIAVMCVLTGCVYGFANMLSGKYYLPGCTFAEMRPQVALPMFMGVLYGPVSGFVCGGLGDMLGYSIAGKGFFFCDSLEYRQRPDGIDSRARRCCRRQAG